MGAVTQAKTDFFAAGARVQIVTTQPVDRALDYLAPEGGVMLGAYVIVPLGPREVLGVVWGSGLGEIAPERLKPVLRVLDLPPMQEELRQFIERAADYTLTAVPAMLRMATRAPGLTGPLPQQINYVATGAQPERMSAARQRVLDLLAAHGGASLGMAEIVAEAAVSASVVAGLEKAGILARRQMSREWQAPLIGAPVGAHRLTPPQQQAASEIGKAISAGGYAAFLLRGVTGSGKTEIYLDAIARVIAQDGQALIMLPEIALTESFITRIEQYFGQPPVEWHSGLSPARRRDAYRAIAKGAAKLVIGARSALFLPYASLGLIVVDEEHDSSYKQEDGAIYHARDMAVLRASIEEAVIILASATPSMESWANADAGKYQRLDLKEQFGTAQLPSLRAIDMRQAGTAPGKWISPALAEAMRHHLGAGEQCLLFLNRRGFAPLTLCRKCGHQLGCPSCDSRLVEHRYLGRMMCHQCGYQTATLSDCPACESEGNLAALGPGVERISEEAQALFPKSRIAVLSSDRARSTAELRVEIENIAKGGADIVVGTQLVAKGYNFPLLTLVGIIDADLGLQGGDLRAGEKTYQLVRQVSGRAGRADRPGQALIQTYQPAHPVIQAILSGDDEAFWRAEAEMRRQAGAPPYGRMVGVVVSGTDAEQTYALAKELANKAEMLVRADCMLFGPAPAPVARIRGRYRFRLLVKAPKMSQLQPLLRSWRASVKPSANIRIVMDIDPQSFM